MYGRTYSKRRSFGAGYPRRRSYSAGGSVSYYNRGKKYTNRAASEYAAKAILRRFGVRSGYFNGRKIYA